MIPGPWRPIETAPRDEIVLVWLPWCDQVTLARYSTRYVGRSGPGWQVMASFSYCFRMQRGQTPECWMPLPPSPLVTLKQRWRERIEFEVMKSTKLEATCPAS